tara:strand:+ start:31391 stop:33970 length:2580 start_codon:yes stop_codon:yes gene_type:complete
MDWYTQSQKEALKNLDSSRDGLNNIQVQKRLSRYGKNILKEYKTKSKLRIFLSQFNSLLIYILILAATISIIIGHKIDFIVIGAIIIINGAIGFIQEYKAETLIKKLRKSLKNKVFVLRNGIQEEIDPKLLVPGDIVLLSAGDNISADCRILEEENLQINEAVLTGESFSVEKNPESLNKSTVLAERKNMIYAGTSVVSGKTTSLVVETGINTEFGKLANLVQIIPDEKMPLEKKLEEFSKNISIIILILVALAFIIGISLGISKIEMFLISISLAIGAIPEGLPAIIAITLAIAIKQMYESKTLIRKLPAAETLGRATVICTDKTGTLTQEELNVDKIYSSNLFSTSELVKITPQVKKLLKIGILCNNARDEKDKILGDQTEIALIKISRKFNILKRLETQKNIRIKEFPFSSQRKLMSIVRQNENIKTSYVKGAPLILLERCNKELVNGKIKLLDEGRKNQLTKILMKMESSGLRVLGFAFRQLTKVDQKNAENNLIFTGFMGMIDPPRPEVKKAIQEAIDAGIKIKIITGDSEMTTVAVAKKIGLKGEAIGGEELNRLPIEKWDEVVRQKTIFARITPKQKLKVVEILKKQNETVAVTGDGVNDILSLKKADIGISMGIRGSEVARDSSDMVLMDDNFASIISAIKQGRRVFDNLKKSIKFLISANVADIFIIIFALILGMPLPFLPLAILWMNLVTDSLPALALAIEPAEKNIMKRGSQRQGLLKGIWKWILVAGILNFISVIWIFNWAISNFNLEVARTMAITTAIFFELFFAFSCKSKTSLFKTGILNNKYLIYAVLISGGLQILAIYSSLGIVFEFVSLTSLQLGASIIISLSGLVVFEGWKLGKLFFKKFK